MKKCKCGREIEYQQHDNCTVCFALYMNTDANYSVLKERSINKKKKQEEKAESYYLEFSRPELCEMFERELVPYVCSNCNNMDGTCYCELDTIEESFD